MAQARRAISVALLGCLVLAGCSQKPVARMDSYLGVAGQGGVYVQADRVTGPLEVGLLLVNETSAEGSAPALSEEAKGYLTNQVSQRVAKTTPIRVVKVLTAADNAQPQDQQALARLAKEQGVSHLLLALFSSAESEIPLMLPFTADPEQGGGRPKALGFEANNYALAELALLDTANGQVIARSDGRAWTRLNRLNVPVKSNGYPVIHRSLRVAPIYPQEENAKDVMRSVAGDEALEQAIYKLEQAWPQS